MTVRGVSGREVRVTVGSVVDVICQHEAEMRIHGKKLTQYLEKQALDKPEQDCSRLLPRVSKFKETLGMMIMSYNSICQLQTNWYTKLE